MKDYQDLAEHAIRRIADHHDTETEMLLIVDVREAIEKAVAEAARPEVEAKMEREHFQMQIGYLAAMVSMHTGREIPAIVAEVNSRIPLPE